VRSVFIKYIKKIIMASFLIYAFNMVAVNFNVVIPINVWTIGFTTIFDVPGIAILLILKTMGV
jgi:pro-sigmaK processing inhibitor BofA